MKIKTALLINSDLAKNRGDRAIAEGNIQLIKQQFPGVRITGLSELPDRDKEWYGIEFLDMNFQSLSPVSFIRLWRAARSHDLVFWGGGEILKDYTNKAALWYWVVKVALLSLANPRIYGAYQGIGPTKSPFSRKLIAYVVNRCSAFIVRDKESYEKLVAWGADTSKLYHASDPAVLPLPAKLDSHLKERLRSEYDITNEFLDDFICIGPREWFHYKPGGLLPFKYKKRLYALLGKSLARTTPEHVIYLQKLDDLIAQLTADPSTNILLVPMHMDESDSELCRRLQAHAQDPSRVRVLDDDSLTPAQLRTVISRAKAMIGFRLHSNIIGISAGVPSLNIYYVDKGRVFFDQINQSQYSMPIEDTLKDDFMTSFLERFTKLEKHSRAIRQEITNATTRLRASVTTTFRKVFDEK